MKKWIILALILAFVAAHRLLLKFFIKKLSESQSKTKQYFRDDRASDNVHADALEKWRAAGLYRKPRKTVLKSLENISPDEPTDAPYEEITELPKTLEEAFEGLSEEEAEKILDIVQEECYE